LSEPSQGTDRPDVTLVFVVYRTPDFLARALDAVVEAAPSCSYEIVVQDNDPLDDASARAVEAWSKVNSAPIQYVHNEQNLGFGRAVNRGIEAGKGRHFLVLNPDVEVRPGSIEALISYADENPDVGLVAPRLEYADGEVQPSCRTFYTLPIFILRRTFLGKIFPNARIIRDHLMMDYDHESTRDVDWCIGGALLARREAVEDVGAMDERFFLYFEDVDWCFRMHQQGWKVIYHPPSRMTHHYQRASAGWKPTRGLWLHLASTVRFYEKWSFVLYWFKLRSSLIRQLAFFFADLLGVVSAFLLAYYLRSLAADILTKPLFSLTLYSRFLLFTLVVAMGSFFAAGHYRQRFPRGFLDNFFPVLRALLWTTVLMMASTFLFSVHTYSRIVVAAFLPLALLLVTTFRASLVGLIQSVKDRDLNLLRVGILAPSEDAAVLERRFARHGNFALDPIWVPWNLRPEEQGGEVTPLFRRLRAERVQELVVFETPALTVSEVVTAAQREGLPVRVVPGLHPVYPTSGRISDFMGYPTVRLGSATTTPVSNPSRRLLDVILAAILGVGLFVPFLLVVLIRVVSRRDVIERARVHGRGGQDLALRRLAGAGTGPRGFWASVLDYYPALGWMALGEFSLVGIYPFEAKVWPELDPRYRAAPPGSLPGIVGPWTGRELTTPELCDWNQRYPRDWSGANDSRIFWKALMGNRTPEEVSS